MSANTPFYNTALGIVMFFSRYWIIIPVLAIAGSLVAKKKVPVGAGTLPTHTPLFVLWLVGVVIVIGALTFFPALALGPIVEHLQLYHGVATHRALTASSLCQPAAVCVHRSARW